MRSSGKRTDKIPIRAHAWKRNARDWYVEPSWCASRLFEVEEFVGTVHDPFCGKGTIPIAARLRGLKATGADVVDRARGRFPVRDFTHNRRQFDNIVSNPPFKNSEEMLVRVLGATRGKLALLLPLGWIAGNKRSLLIEKTCLARVWVLTPRPSMPPGQVIARGEKAKGGTIDFAWFVWSPGNEGPPTIQHLRRDD